MKDKNQIPIPLTPVKPPDRVEIKLTPTPPVSRQLIVPTTKVSRDPPAEIRPKTTPDRRQIAPPRPKDDRHSRSSIPPHLPLHEESRVLEQQRSTLRVPIGDNVVAQIKDAARRCDQRSLKKAARVGAMLGVDEEHAREERRLMRREENARFANAIKRAKDILKRIRAPKSVYDLHNAYARFYGVHLQVALLSDPRGRSWDDLLALLGTSEAELDFLPDLFTTVTIIPAVGLHDRFYQPRCARYRHKDCKPEVQTIEVGERTVDVIYRCGHPFVTLEPITKIAPGQPIDPPKPKIRLLMDGSYRLELADAGYLMRREHMRIEGLKVVGNEAVEYQLVGEDRWVYFRLSVDDTCVPTDMLLRRFDPDGFIEPQSRKLLTFFHEVGSEHYCYLAAQTHAGKVVISEIPWSDVLQTLSEGATELVCGFTSKLELSSEEALAELTPATSTTAA